MRAPAAATSALALLFVVAPVSGAEQASPPGTNAAAAQPLDPALVADLDALRPKRVAGAPETTDPRFLAVVKRGLDAVPPLIDRLEDDTPTGWGMPESVGNYAKGDVAMEALLEIVDLPWQELVPRSVKAKVHDLGYDAYVEYVRASKDNRRQFASASRGWFRKNRAALKFEPLPGHPAGGLFVAPD